MRVTDPGSCTHVEETTREKLTYVLDRIRELRRMERTLHRLHRSCETRQPTDECPVLASLAFAVACRRVYPRPSGAMAATKAEQPATWSIAPGDSSVACAVPMSRRRDRVFFWSAAGPSEHPDSYAKAAPTSHVDQSRNLHPSRPETLRAQAHRDLQADPRYSIDACGIAIDVQVNTQIFGSRSKYSSSSFEPPSPLPSCFSDSTNSIRSTHLTILYPSWFSTRSRSGAP